MVRKARVLVSAVHSEKKEKEALDHLADGVDDVSQYKTLSAPYICVWSVLIFNL